jgi:hypothetical protein
MDNICREVTMDKLLPGDTLHLEVLDFEYELIGLIPQASFLLHNLNGKFLPLSDLGNGNFQVLSYNTKTYEFELPKDLSLYNDYRADGMVKLNNDLIPLDHYLAD